VHASYQDILDRIDAAPVWWDENGVPRFDPHHPDLCPDVYAREVALIRIECQSCQLGFLVQMSTGSPRARGSLTEMIRNKTIHYGDPPRHDVDCMAGDTMNCTDIAVVEFWRWTLLSWERVTELEIDLR
jgi:hypothetical protein